MASTTDFFKVSNFERNPLSWWKTQRAKIDMNPPYQRKGGIWSASDKAFLIDSILNDYDIPKIYLADFTFGRAKLNKRHLSYAIVDGKQRFEAIFDFFDGRITLEDDFKLRENPRLKLGGLGYSDLRKNYPEIADKFDAFPLTVMRIVTDKESLINELFVRLNRSKPLTGAEVRNAAVGPVSQSVREIASHEFFTSYVSFQDTRLQRHNAAAKLLYFEYKRGPAQTKKRDLDSFVKDTQGKTAQVGNACRAVLDVLDELVDVFLPKDKLLSSAGVLPDYYWFVRNTPTEKRARVRDFLLEFERRRRRYLDTLSNRKEGRRSDSAVAQFVEWNRDTNDKGAHEGRISVLTKEFKLFLRSAPRKSVRKPDKATA